MRKSLWSPDEDEKLRQYVAKHGCGNWSDVAKYTGLHRCGKSCRLRWINYLRPDLKRGPFTSQEVRLVVSLHNKLGNSWSKIATHLPGRTDNDVKNFWHSYTRSRRLALQQQQRQRMNITGPQDNDDKKLCYSDVYNHHGSKKNKEVKDHGYGAHHGLPGPSSKFPPKSIHISKEVGDCNVSFLNENNAPPFRFNIGDNQLRCTSPKTNTDRSNQVPPYPRAHLRPSPPELKDNVVVAAPINTNAKPVMMHDRFANDAECVIYKGLQSCITDNQFSSAKLGSYASNFYPPTSSVEASSTAVLASRVHDSTKRSNTQATSCAADDQSFLFSPSMHANDVINLQVLADDAPEANSLNQANGNGGNSRPPEGLQSVIWRFFNQRDGDPAASPTSLHQDNQRAHTTHQYVPHHHHHQKPHHHHHQKPYTSIAISSLSLSGEPSIQFPIQQLPTANQLMNVEEAFSSYASCLQYLQAQVLAADC